MGRHDEAIARMKKSQELDPLSLIIATDNAAILYYSRQYDRAIAQITSVRELDPEFPRTTIIVAAYAQKGMFAEAQADIEKHQHEESPWRSSNLAYIYARASQTKKAAHELKKLLDSNKRQPIDSMLIVPAYIGMGNNDQALAWLEKARAQHSNGLTALKVDPIYDPLRADPRFQQILRQVGLAD